ncbi:enoyl-CoA hydratase-related protein [Meiothermus ruber]|jgi:2-(1,2-epoxy-1,2-dihydrophenyl)acetyl-CoA isomerase|uniref:Enoyl-CoA hydratase/isomerase n=1 Tax=Meiothermus ruber (strain ATCC 35948 / DSM 1279 / VKM B-1258 / 21) TaxID=504728 RepID=D3PSX3_MEIRD|nr:enoyl-CoA hydratase-related protein [Meiothermus ruber]ADD28556.1 Enoyl-CoA hydratase/isomerase [Meiothermus ruber DSM 1279]AGK06001.1 Enoyl-CoA hydratase/isomerase [Meiothermus ruber DSM 1279]MCL6530727.1 enoyl-CoA hydratase/isomerase family protein [Meiothermus ruber]MCX7802073.1 enoyl-CoA hydratase-related protein [Meiothermus ruber]GAO75517.1 Enoyl-CoA hydratase/isomerase [Meiothermus ruber H328]
MEVLLREQSNGILTLTLNRPEAINALTTEMLRELSQALKEAAAPEVRVVVLRGAGRGFCSGQDLREFAGQRISYKNHLRNYRAVVEGLAGLEKPVIAAIHGAAAGAGLSLALACDLRIASSDAVLTTGFSRIGLIPDAGMNYHLPRMVGYAKAFELEVLSERLKAEEALALGLVNRVVPAESFAEEVARLAGELAQGPTKTYGLIKRALRRSAGASLEEMLEYEALLQEVAGRTEDHQEGVQAFYEKRPPRFQGR